MAMIKDLVSAPGIGVPQIVKRCNSLSYYYYQENIHVPRWMHQKINKENASKA
jgi:hypothetical protein